MSGMSASTSILRNQERKLLIDCILQKGGAILKYSPTLEPNIVKYQSDYQILISEIVW